MKLNKYLLIIVLQLITRGYLVGTNLRNGDLIFQESCSGDNTGDAIKSVTDSSKNYNFTHVGIVYIPQDGDGIYVIEATPPKVKITSIDEFLGKNSIDKCTPISVLGRLNKTYEACIPQALDEALKFVGKEYDYGFILNNDKYYCSELIYLIFLKANNGIPVFNLNIMTFKQKNSKKFDKNWIQYFEEKNLTIPEGEMGINPGAMSLSDRVGILGELKLSDL